MGPPAPPLRPQERSTNRAMSTTPAPRRRRTTGLAAVMLLPSAIILAAFVVYPLIRAVFLGRQRCDAQAQHCRTNGWVQYVDVFRSREFQNAIGVTIKFALITVPLALILGVALAVLADKYLRGIGF